MPSGESLIKNLHITTTAARIIGLPFLNPTKLNNMAITCIATLMKQDMTHPLNIYLIPLPSGLTYRALRCRRARFGAKAAPNERPYWTVQSVNETLYIVCFPLCVLNMKCSLVGIVFWMDRVLWKGISPMGTMKPNARVRLQDIFFFC